MNEFELDEEIEVSEHPDFCYSVTAYFLADECKSKYKVKSCEKRYHVITKDGHVCFYSYARKIEPKVSVWLEDWYGERYEIPKELADKIKRGDV